jgi:hypothetical protein
MDTYTRYVIGWKAGGKEATRKTKAKVGESF